MRHGCITILFVILFFHCNAQQDNNYIFRHIDQSDGLLHNRIYSIAQDGKGYIWILSPNGLQRYDGYRFINYPYDPNNPGKISYKQDCSLFADKKNGRLWVIHENIAQLDLQKNRFIYYNTEQLRKDTSFGFEIYKDSAERSWVAGNFGVFYADKSTPPYFTASWLNPQNCSSFFIDQENEQAWLALWGYGLLLFDKKTKRIYSNNYNPIHNPLLQLFDQHKLFYFFKDSEKNLWITSSDPVFYKYNPATQKITTYPCAGIEASTPKNKFDGGARFVHCIFEDNHRNIWVGTQNAGLLKYNYETDHFISITGRNEKQQGIKYNYDINCIMQDSDDNLWLGTDKGITIFNPYQQYFQSISHSEADAASLPKYEVQGCIETKNEDILVATWGGGITFYDKQWNFKKNIQFNSDPPEYNLPWSLIQNDNGTIWIGCQHGYIHIYDPLKATINTIHPPELNNSTIYCMAKDKAGDILFGLHNGKIGKWNKEENRFYSYNENLPVIQQSYTPVQNIFIDDAQHCWAGTESGMKEFDMGRMNYTSVYVMNNKDPNAISVNTIQSIDSLNDSSLVIGTVYGGINFFNKKTKTFSHLNDYNNLSSNTINCIKKDEQGNLWFTTNYDLYKYSPGENKFTHYNIETGIVNSVFKFGHFYCLNDGRWVTNTETELICFSPDSLQNKQTRELLVNITGFKMFDKEIFIDSFLYANKPVKLSYEQNFISIEYGALNFSGLQETKYYYQLTGVNKDWVSAGSQRSANYTNLAPGTYTFQVRAGNETTGKITSFKIIIDPPFWQTSWFRLLVIILVTTLTYLFFKKRVKSIRHEAHLKHRIAETEMMALRAQMNPHFIFNCINSIDALIQSNDKYQATVYLNKFAKLIRNILDSSKQNLVTLSKDMETLQLYIDLEKFRSENKFTATINVEKELMQDNYKIPALIIQPYVENAIIHGLRKRKDNNGMLFISATNQKDRLRFIIEDNGVGRQIAATIKQEIKESYGMQMSSERVKLFNNEGKASVFISDLEKDGKATGTKVEVFLNI